MFWSLQSNALNFAWNGGQFVGKQNFLSVPGQYVIEAFAVNQCKTVDTLDIYNYTVATATASPQVISPGESTTLSSTGGTSYYWFADAPSYYSNQLGSSIHGRTIRGLLLTTFKLKTSTVVRIRQVFRFLLVSKTLM